MKIRRNRKEEDKLEVIRKIKKIVRMMIIMEKVMKIMRGIQEKRRKRATINKNQNRLLNQLQRKLPIIAVQNEIDRREVRRK